jgi:hypothetical protein
MTTEENDGLMTEEQLKQSLNDSARGRLRRAGYKLVWEGVSSGTSEAEREVDVPPHWSKWKS